MQHGKQHGDMDMEHEHEKNGHAALACRMDMLNGIRDY
jgi:hypothetical protein